MNEFYQVRFYFRLAWLLLPIRRRRKESILGIAFFLTDHFQMEIPPSDAYQFISTDEESKTFIVSGSKEYSIGLRMKIVTL
jgi:hypothetical protein